MTDVNHHSRRRSTPSTAPATGALTPDEAAPAASSLALAGGPRAGSNAGDGSNKRKRGAPAVVAPAAATSASSRGVANLTPEQLERKRANDREAQRAIRERTKQQIERLNDRIRDLESSQPYQDLQAVVQQKNAVQAENDDIKRQLASFMSIFQRYVGGGPPPVGLQELAAVAEREVLPYAAQDQSQMLPQQEAYPPSLGPPDHHSPHDARSVGSPMSSTSMNRPFPHGYNHQQLPNPNRNWIPPPPSAYEHLSRNLHPELAYPQNNDERLGVDFLLGETSQPQPLPPQQQRLSRPSVNGMSQSPPTSVPESPGHYNTIPRRMAATCPLDAILLDAVAERNRARKIGLAKEEVVGPLYPNWNHLLNKNTSTPNHTVSKLIIDICRTFPDLHKLPEQVAVIYIMFLITRWEVEPTKENYERLPEWVRPLPSQLFTPHPCWLDYLPWPRLRDAAVQTSPFPNFDTFFVPYTTTLSLNWPYAPTDVLLPSAGPPHPLTHSAAATSPGSASSHGSPGRPETMWRINPAFETHLRDLGNWSLGTTFRETFPDWANAVRIKEEGEVPRRHVR